MCVCVNNGGRLALTLSQGAVGGYEHYEVSSYAKPGARCAHNQTYWQSGRKGWYGFGMAATSHVQGGGGERVSRPRKMRDYEAWVEAMLPLDHVPSVAVAGADANVADGSGDAAADRSAGDEDEDEDEVGLCKLRAFFNPWI